MGFPDPFYRWRPHPWRGLETGLERYFLTYKTLPGEDHQVEIPEIYGREHALAVVSAATQDYEDHYGG
jgi:hypothetical protein